MDKQGLHNRMYCQSQRANLSETIPFRGNAPGNSDAGILPGRKIGMKSPIRIYAILALAVFLVMALVADASARGRTGSFRVGGYTSHGKGSHYVGGR